MGHATQHQGDLVKQTMETLQNIDAVRNRVCHEGSESRGEKWSEGLLKVFVRQQEDLHAVRKALDGYEYGNGPILYVLGEMCRKELLVEIEGMWNLAFLSHE